MSKAVEALNGKVNVRKNKFHFMGTCYITSIFSTLMRFYLRFPKRADQKLIWTTQIKIGNNQSEVNDCGVVCSLHFNKEDTIQTNKNTRLLSSAIPKNFPRSG